MPLKLLLKLLRRRGGGATAPPIDYLEVSDLCFDGEGIVSYKFRIRLAGEARVLSFNRMLEPRLGAGWRVRERVERGLGWATLKAAYPPSPFREAEGEARGGVEDFTLSAYGARRGRAILKDETIWHPVPSDDVVSWGFRGSLRSYRVSASRGPGCRGRMAAPGFEVESGVFEGEATHRSPGLSVVVAPYSVYRVESMEAYARRPLSRAELAAVRDALSLASETLESKRLPAPRPGRIVELWDETDPFAQDNMIALRPRVLRGLASGSGAAEYEAYTLLGAQASMSSSPSSISDYWVYESLPEAVGMALSLTLKGPALEAARERARQLEACVREYSGGRGLPVLGSGLPRTSRARAAVRCAAPLAYWVLASRLGVEALWALIRCILSRPGYSEETAENCARSIDESFASEVLAEGRFERWLR